MDKALNVVPSPAGRTPRIVDVWGGTQSLGLKEACKGIGRQLQAEPGRMESPLS